MGNIGTDAGGATAKDLAKQNRLSSTRKSLVAITAIALVFWANENRDINWIVKLSGLKAWASLLLAQLYFLTMWYANGGFSRVLEAFKKPNLSGGNPIGNAERLLHRRQAIMLKPFTNLIWLAGFLVIVWNLYRAYRFGSPMHGWRGI